MARYGRTRAAELLQRGDAEEALEAADEVLEGGATGAEAARAHLDRGAALDLLERHLEAAEAFERAAVLDEAGELDPLELDDGYFAAALAAARAEAASGSVAEAVARLDGYVTRLPSGTHVKEARAWKARLRGELPSLLDKTRDANDVDLP